MATLEKMQKPMARSRSAWWPHGRTWQKALVTPELSSITRSTAARPAPTARSAGSQDFGDSTRVGIEPHRLFALAGRWLLTQSM